MQPGAVVAGIVPTSETLLVEARVSPKDVAFIQPNQHALIKITAYDFSIFGGIGGKVANVSADSLVDPNTGEPYYQVQGGDRPGQRWKARASLTRSSRAWSVLSRS